MDMPKNAKVIKNFFLADAQSAIAPIMGEISAIIIEAMEFAIPNCKVLWLTLDGSAQ